MTTIQQVLFQLEGDYLGHPYYVSGHAIATAIADRLDAGAHHLHASMGVFVPGAQGNYPDAHSQSGGPPYFGTGLRPVETYDDLFLFRDGAQRWLRDGDPRDAHNTHDLREYGDRTAYAPSRSFGRPPDARNTKRTVNWYVHCYLYSSGDTDTVPVADDVLDGLRLGGARNYGFGLTSLKDAQTVDLHALDYGRLERADAYRIELCSPYVLDSEFPEADAQEVPWWWDADGELRRRRAQLVREGEAYDLTTVDHGQVVGYAGANPVATAKNGVLRTGTHAQFGFGEFRVRPADGDRVPERCGADGDGATDNQGGMA